MFIDFYKLLELQPSATHEKIKRAFRLAALKYHPDRTSNNKALGEKFREVKLAYETLGNEQRRRQYDLNYLAYYRQHYKRQAPPHNYAAAKGKVTPQAYLKALKQLNTTTGKLKWHQVNQVALLNAINKLLPDKVIRSLIVHDDISLNREVNALVLQYCKKLNKQNTNVIRAKLIRLAGTDNEALKQIYQFTESDLIVYYKSAGKGISNLVTGILNPIRNIALVKNLFKMKRGMGW